MGLVSRDGIIPITADQDTAGPLARTVTDAAILLGVIAGYDVNDPATAPCLEPGDCFDDYTQFLDKKALIGARIAVPPFPDTRAAIMNNAIDVLRAQGAYVEHVAALAPQFGGCNSSVYPPADDPPPPALRCTTVLNYGFKRDLNAYFAAHLPITAPVKTLQNVVDYNIAHAADTPSSIKYGQALALFSQMFDTTAGSADTVRYERDRAEDILRSRGTLDAAYNGPDEIEGTADDFDALLFSGNSGAGTPAKAGVSRHRRAGRLLRQRE